MSTKSYSPRLADKYTKEVVPALVKKFSYDTVMQAPKLEKICLNRGVNGAVTDKKLIDIAISVALPRVRDFKGISEKSFDGRGNYTMGVTEQIIFPEIDIDKVNKITGLDITFVTTANNDEEAYELLKELGMPFKNAAKTNSN